MPGKSKAKKTKNAAAKLPELRTNTKSQTAPATAAVTTTTVATAITKTVADVQNKQSGGGISNDKLAVMLKYAKAYWIGDGVPQDHKRAFELYYNAYHQAKSFQAMYMLGLFYLYGYGCIVDLDKSLDYFNKLITSYPKKTEIIYGLAQNYYLRMKKSSGTAHAQHTANFLMNATKGTDLGDVDCALLLLKHYSQDTSSSGKYVFYQYIVKAMQNPLINTLPEVRIYYGQCYLYGWGVEINTEEALKHLEWAVAQKTCSAEMLIIAKTAKAVALLEDRSYFSKAERKKRYGEAINILEEQATKGDKYARYCLLRYYLIHNGRTWDNEIEVTQNIVRAKHWAQLTVAENDPKGFLALADIQALEKNYTESFNNYKKALELGDLGGLPDLGRCYQYGLGVEPDFKRAYELFVQFKKQDEYSACYHLAGLLFYQKNPKFIEYLEQSATKAPISMFIVGLMYALGVYVTRDLEKGLNYLIRHIELTNCLDLIRNIISIIQISNKIDPENQPSVSKIGKITEMIQRIADPLLKLHYMSELKNAQANEYENSDQKLYFETCMSYLGEKETMSSRRIIDSYAKNDIFGTEILEKINLLFDAYDLCCLAKCYLLGKGTSIDIPLGLKYLKRAADLGSAESQYLYARACESGNEAEKTSAVTYYKLAADQNHKLAKVHLSWKTQLKKNNDTYFVNIINFPNIFYELTELKQSFLPLSSTIENEITLINHYKVEHLETILSQADFNAIEGLKIEFSNLQQKASQLCDSFEEAYQKIYMRCTSLCKENNESVKGLWLEIRHYEDQYQTCFKAAKLCQEKLIAYRQQMETQIKAKAAKNKLQSVTNTVASKPNNTAVSVTDLKQQNENKKTIEKLQVQIRKEKREAWLKKQRDFFEKQKSEQALAREQRKLSQDFLNELEHRPLQSKVFLTHNFQFVKKSKQRNLSEWQIHELLRIEGERKTLEAIYNYIKTSNVPPEKQTAEDVWIIRQALVGILGRFMEVLQFITVKQEILEDKNLSLNQAARRIRNLFLKRDYLNDILSTHSSPSANTSSKITYNDTSAGFDVSSGLEFSKQKNAELLAITKTLSDYFKTKNVKDFPNSWQQFKIDIDSSLLENMVEHESPISSILSLNTCVIQVEAAKNSLARLSKYNGPYKNIDFIKLVDEWIKTKWGTTSAYVKRNKASLIKSATDKQCCLRHELIRDDYIQLGNRFRHAHKPLVFTNLKPPTPKQESTAAASNTPNSC